MSDSYPRIARDGTYVVGDGALPTGSTLGGPDLCVTLKGTGAIGRVASLLSGKALVSGLALRHWDLAFGVPLAPSDGTFELRPESQVHRYRLGDDLLVEETTFVLDDERSSVSACYVAVRLRNNGPRGLHVGAVAVARIAGRMTGRDVETRYDHTRHALVAWDRSGAENARAIALSAAPASWVVTSDHGRVLAERWDGAFERTIDADGSDPLGVLQLEHRLAPGEELNYDVRVVALPAGRESAGAILRALPPAREALAGTRARYAAALARAIVLAPERDVELGVHWAKANMLRVMRRTPTGPGFTNDPGNSAACVGRDAAWFVHGCDWMEPAFSRALLDAFAARQEPDGKIVEWYDLRDGTTHDDGLDVNDDTPLFVLAVWHHAIATGSREALEALYPPAARAAEQLLAHRDDGGLVRSSSHATGPEGIVGWRNVIDGYRISGATTELNCGTYAALRRLAELATELGRADDAARWEREAGTLRAAIERRLRNPDNGMYYLCVDADGRARSELSSDLVFPVMFGVSDEATSARIVTRLRERDFWTAAGLRTVPRDAPEYDPVRGHGLLGGVWVAVTFWYAFAAAAFVPEIMGEALAASFRHYASDPMAHNTVPGQFSEWLHGETLANEGMHLSPWFAPRYVWAAIEGACGLQPGLERLRVEPHIPPGWNWIAVRDVPLHGLACSVVVVRSAGLRIFATCALESPHPVDIYERDVTGEVRAGGADVAVVALRAGRRIVVFLGNREDHTVNVTLAHEGALAALGTVRTYDALRAAWSEPAANGRPATVVSIPGRGFALVGFSAGDASAPPK